MPNDSSWITFRQEIYLQIGMPSGVIVTQKPKGLLKNMPKKSNFKPLFGPFVCKMGNFQ